MGEEAKVRVTLNNHTSRTVKQGQIALHQRLVTTEQSVCTPRFVLCVCVCVCELTTFANRVSYWGSGGCRREADARGATRLCGGAAHAHSGQPPIRLRVCLLIHHTVAVAPR